ncbi:hypothetical protein HK097_005751 [Rhizophlyctis rosea]|uniref:Ras GTPase-activating-like protein IQGAP1 n=1 Tax=Rhizophlyctis rosea TaxID=64517 RepID=A0AAD5X8W1_9FUNG|nr:hypothetical protein HK097_005751 [Rhizophlyctis rosea]
MSDQLSPLADLTSATSPKQSLEMLNAISTEMGDVAGMHGRVRFKFDPNHTKDASILDKERSLLQAYEYLCHIGEAKEWIEACIKEQIAPIEQLDEELRNGIVLARLARTFEPKAVKKIFEDRTKLQFRHSDNINYLFDAMRQVGLPEVFFFELTDLYDKKNIPKVIYCIHALSHLLAKKGLAPAMKNLVGQLSFTDEQLDATQQELDESGVTLPSFSGVGDALKKELKEEPVLTEEQKRDLYFQNNVDKVVRGQAAIRGKQARRRYQKLLEQDRADKERLRAEEERRRLEKVTKAQSVIRMHQQRRKFVERKEHFAANEDKITRIQAGWKAKKASQAYHERLRQLKGNGELWSKLQARIKGKHQRARYQERLKYLNSHEAEIVKIQSSWRAKKMAKAYRGLSSLKNPDVKTLQNFLHLLDDSDEDFEEELDVERLRQLVIKKIRENLSLEQEVNELDVKISLLVKNRITLEEVIHATSKKKRALLSGALLQDKDTSTWNLSGKDKDNRSRRERYGQLFYLLQTQPQYLARTMFAMNKTSGTTVTRFLEQVVLTLYGYAQNPREEYMLLNLIKTAIKVEFEEITKPDEFLRANPYFIKLVLQYTRGVKNASFLRDLLAPLIKSVLTDPTLDLETEPIGIWKTLIREEESRTGEKSSRSYDATPQQAAEDPEVKAIQAAHVEKLREITDQFLNAIIGSLNKMPFGIRYIAMELRETMREKFPGSDDEILKCVGNLLYYRYMNPAIVAPEAFDVIETNTQITPTQRKNLADVAKLLHQISVGKLFVASEDQHGEMNKYLNAASKKFLGYFREASTVETAEEYFNMDEYADVGKATKPTILITQGEIVQVHRSLLDNLEDLIGTNEKDPLKQILDDLGAPPSQPVDEKNGGSEISLALVNRFTSTEDEKDLRLKQLFTETKRFVLAIIRVQTGKNLLDILEAPVTEREEGTFTDLAKKEVEAQAARRNFELRSAQQLKGSNAALNGSVGDLTKSNASIPRSQSTLVHSTMSASKETLLRAPDGSTITFFQLKRRALENMAKLESEGLVTKSNSYQDMLNSIAKDMLNKHRRRSQRQRELDSLRQTLTNLEEKASYLEDQKKSYHSYIDACMAQLNKKTKDKKKPLIFTKQYYHMKDVQKTGKVPQFGSYKYSAADLYKKGVLVGIDDYSPKQYGQITLTISSDEAGVFNVEASFLGIKMPDKMELRLEDLLQAQYNNVSVITLFEGAKVNVNLLIFLLNKKFYV